MNPKAPRIGFDRFIHLDWATIALRVRAGYCSAEELTDLLDAAHSGVSAKTKTRTVLKRLWLEPRPDMVEFADRAVEIYRQAPDTPVSALTWGMAIAAYPFFGKVAETVGRLTALHGSCASAAVQRRMAETYGEREGTYRMTNMILQSQDSWGVIHRPNRGTQIVRAEAIDLNGTPAAEWLAEACLRYTGQAMDVTSLESHSAIFPFRLGGHSISYLLSEAPFCHVQLDGGGNHIVRLRDSL